MVKIDQKIWFAHLSMYIDPIFYERKKFPIHNPFRELSSEWYHHSDDGKTNFNPFYIFRLSMHIITGFTLCNLIEHTSGITSSIEKKSAVRKISEKYPLLVYAKLRKGEAEGGGGLPLCRKFRNLPRFPIDSKQMMAVISCLQLFIFLSYFKGWFLVTLSSIMQPKPPQQPQATFTI